MNTQVYAAAPVCPPASPPAMPRPRIANQAARLRAAEIRVVRSTSWIASVRERTCVFEVIVLLGATPKGRNRWTCPACGEHTRSSTDRRGPVYRTHDGARCARCGVGNDALAWVHAIRGSWTETRAWFAARGLADEIEPARGGSRTIASTDRMRAVQLTAVSPDIPALLHLWTRSLPVAAPLAEQVVVQRNAWCAFAENGIDPSLATRLDLARILPPDAELPGCVPDWWRKGWSLLLPVWNHEGAFAGIRARFVGPRWKGGRRAPPFAGKELSCVGAASGGRTYACPMGVALLRGEREIVEGDARLQWDGRILIAEGGRGYLAARCAPWAAPVPAPNGASYCTHAVLGLWSGSWSQDLADRVPAGTTVLLASDHDDAGDRYADLVVSTLEHRCRVLRWNALTEAAHDRDP